MKTTAFIATTLALLLTAFAVSPAAAAQGPDEPNCMPVYNEYNLGPVTIVQYSSCSYDVKYNGADPCGWEPAVC